MLAAARSGEGVRLVANHRGQQENARLRHPFARHVLRGKDAASGREPVRRREAGTLQTWKGVGRIRSVCGKRVSRVVCPSSRRAGVPDRPETVHGVAISARERRGRRPPAASEGRMGLVGLVPGFPNLIAFANLRDVSQTCATCRRRPHQFRRSCKGDGL